MCGGKRESQGGFLGGATAKCCCCWRALTSSPSNSVSTTACWLLAQAHHACGRHTLAQLLPHQELASFSRSHLCCSICCQQQQISPCCTATSGEAAPPEPSPQEQTPSCVMAGVAGPRNSGQGSRDRKSIVAFTVVPFTFSLLLSPAECLLFGMLM